MEGPGVIVGSPEGTPDSVDGLVEGTKDGCWVVVGNNEGSLFWPDGATDGVTVRVAEKDGTGD